MQDMYDMESNGPTLATTKTSGTKYMFVDPLSPMLPRRRERVRGDALIRPPLSPEFVNRHYLLRDDEEKEYNNLVASVNILDCMYVFEQRKEQAES